VQKAERYKVLRIRKLRCERKWQSSNQRGNAFQDGPLRVQFRDERRTAGTLLEYAAGMG